MALPPPVRRSETRRHHRPRHQVRNRQVRQSPRQRKLRLLRSPRPLLLFRLPLLQLLIRNRLRGHSRRRTPRQRPMRRRAPGINPLQCPRRRALLPQPWPRAKMQLPRRTPAAAPLIPTRKPRARRRRRESLRTIENIRSAGGVTIKTSASWTKRPTLSGKCRSARSAIRSSRTMDRAFVCGRVTSNSLTTTTARRAAPRDRRRVWDSSDSATKR